MKTAANNSLDQIMRFNTRSVLRPEYFRYSNSENMSFNNFYADKFSDGRVNTNTAPVYSTDNPGPPRRKISQKRTSSHPYFRSVKMNLTNNKPTSENSDSFTNSNHTPQHSDCSTMTNQISLIHDNSWKAQTGKSLKNQINPLSTTFSSNSSRHRSDNSSTTSSPNESANPSTHPRSYSHGQAEQLRRSRESTTFALIDNQLSKPPLNQVRDMYLQNRVGVTSSSAPARTTKKANLSAVHTVVRFRIEDYLLPMMSHLRRMLDALFSSLYTDYNSSIRDNLALQFFGQSQLSCSVACEFCDRFRCQLDRQISNRKTMYSKSASINHASISNDSLNNQNLSCSRPCFKRESSAITTPPSSPSSSLCNYNIMDETSNSEIMEALQDVEEELHLSPKQTEEIPLPDIKQSPSRTRLDSVSARLQEVFEMDSMYWSPNCTDFVGSDVPIDLQNLIFGCKTDPYNENSSNLPLLDDLEALDKLPLLENDFDIHVKKENYSPIRQYDCFSSSSSCSSHIKSTYLE